MGPTTPKGFDRRHAVSAAQEQAWGSQKPPAVRERPPTLAKRILHRAGLGLDNGSLWVPQTTVRYSGILDHGIRRETHGVVLHVNAGYAKGTLGFFTNGLAEPWGSEGVGAHFEISGRSGSSIYGDVGSVQLLPLDRVAWHAVDANAYSIGIEHAGFGRTVAEWESTHYNEIGNSAYRTAWILRRFDLGPPHLSIDNPAVGNVWFHSTGGLSWGGHSCPGSAFPSALWLHYATKAYAAKWMWK